MHKVPVGSSVAHAYGFLLRNLTVVLGTAWLPALLYAVGVFVFLQNTHDWMPIARHDVASVVLTACTLAGAWALALMIRSVIGISLTQEALGVRKDFTLAHFVIGPRELRLFFAYIRLCLVALVLYAVVVAISVGAMYAAQHYGAAIAPKAVPGKFPLAVWAAALLTVVLLVWYALAVLRLFFPLAAVASAEHHTRLTRAWTITRGSTFRILLVYLGTFLPLAIAAVLGLYFLVGPDQWAAAMHAAQQQKAGQPPALLAFCAAHALVFAASAGVLSLVGGALLAGAAAHAYRAVTGHELAELEDDAALVAPLLEPEFVAPAPMREVVPAREPDPEPVEELPPPVHHDHDHANHGIVDEAPVHHDQHASHADTHESAASPQESPATDAHGDHATHSADAAGHHEHPGERHHESPEPHHESHEAHEPHDNDGGHGGGHHAADAQDDREAA